jgi:hypothetical protein
MAGWRPSWSFAIAGVVAGWTGVCTLASAVRASVSSCSFPCPTRHEGRGDGFPRLLAAGVRRLDRRDVTRLGRASTAAGHVFGIELPNACSARHGSWRSSTASGELVRNLAGLAAPLGLNGHHGRGPESLLVGALTVYWQATAPSHRRCPVNPNDAEHHVFQRPLDPGRRPRRRPDRRLFGSYVTAAHRRPYLPTCSVTRPRWRSPPRGPGG